MVGMSNVWGWITHHLFIASLILCLWYITAGESVCKTRTYCNNEDNWRAELTLGSTSTYRLFQLLNLCRTLLWIFILHLTTHLCSYIYIWGWTATLIWTSLKRVDLITSSTPACLDWPPCTLIVNNVLNDEDKHVIICCIINILLLYLFHLLDKLWFFVYISMCWK